jgi:hypothetical protein
VYREWDGEGLVASDEILGAAAKQQKDREEGNESWGELIENTITLTNGVAGVAGVVRGELIRGVEVDERWWMSGGGGAGLVESSDGVVVLAVDDGSVMRVVKVEVVRMMRVEVCSQGDGC